MIRFLPRAILRFPTIVFICWKRQGHGALNVEDSIAQSCDVFFYSISQKVGIDKISAMARRFGLGEYHDLPLSAISRGVAPTRAWKQKSFDKAWLIGDTVNASIGQGYVLASPLQLAIMAARLGTGRAVQPRLLQSIDDTAMPLGTGASFGCGSCAFKSGATGNVCGH